MKWNWAQRNAFTAYVWVAYGIESLVGWVGERLPGRSRGRGRKR